MYAHNINKIIQNDYETEMLHVIFKKNKKLIKQMSY